MTTAQRIIRSFASRGITMTAINDPSRIDGRSVRCSPADKLTAADRDTIANNRAPIVDELMNPFVHDWPYIDRRHLRVHFLHVGRPLNQASPIVLLKYRSKDGVSESAAPYTLLSGPLLAELAQVIASKLDHSSEQYMAAQRFLSDAASFLAAQPEHLRIAAAATFQPHNSPQHRAAVAELAQVSRIIDSAGLYPVTGHDAANAKWQHSWGHPDELTKSKMLEQSDTLQNDSNERN